MRDTNTMPQWAGSCWVSGLMTGAANTMLVTAQCSLLRYTSPLPSITLSATPLLPSQYYLRYISPSFSPALVDPAAERYWMPVDLYVGGAEHAVLHLLYARFWHKFLFDIGAVSTPEPFQRLVSQGMILGEVEYAGAKTEGGEWVSGEGGGCMGGGVVWEWVSGEGGWWGVGRGVVGGE